MMVAAEVPRMAVHSATVARRKRSHSESGIRCRGSSSFRVILVAVKPVNFGRLKLNCAVMLSWVLPKSSLHSSWKTQVGCPKFSQMWSSTCYCHNTSGPPQSTCPPQLQEPCRESSALVNQLSTIGLRWQGIPAEDAALGARSGRRSRAWLLGCLSSEGSSGEGACTLRSWWLDGWVGVSGCARRACSAVSRDTASWGGHRLRSRNPCEFAAVTAWITGGSGSCSGRGSNADCGTVGIKAEALSSSSAAARSAGGWSACSSRAPSRSTSVAVRELLELNFHFIQ